MATKPKYTIGNVRKRIVLNSNGQQIAAFNNGHEDLAQQFAEFLNSNNAKPAAKKAEPKAAEAKVEANTTEDAAAEYVAPAKKAAAKK